MQENDTKIHSNLQKELSLTEQQAEETKSKSLSDASKSDFKALSDSPQYNIPLNQEKGLHEPNFITLKQIPEQERVEIIQTGFQRQAEGKIWLKKYYESPQEYSLFQFKGYCMRYESIRKSKLYQQLKDK